MKPGYFDRYRQRKAIKKLARFNDEAEDFVKLGEEMASIEKGIKERGLENSEISMNPDIAERIMKANKMDLLKRIETKTGRRKK